MTVTFVLDNSETIPVHNDIALGSEVIASLIEDTGREDIIINVPDTYTHVFNIYVDFLYGGKPPIVFNDIANQYGTIIEALLICFDMESYYADDLFFKYLMSAAYPVWNEFIPHITDLPDERTIYLHTPHKYIPLKYINKPIFFNEWLTINQNKKIVVNRNPLTFSPGSPYDNSESHRVDTKYHNNGNINSIHIYYVVNYKNSGHEIEMGWYVNGQPEYIHNFINIGWDPIKTKQNTYIYSQTYRYLNGLQEAWYSTGNRKYKSNYVDGHRNGTLETWYEDGKIRESHNQQTSRYMYSSIDQDENDTFIRDYGE